MKNNKAVEIVENVKNYMGKNYTNLRYSIYEDRFAVIFKKNDLGYYFNDGKQSITITYEPLCIDIAGYVKVLGEDMEVNKKRISDEMFFYDL